MAKNNGKFTLLLITNRNNPSFSLFFTQVSK